MADEDVAQLGEAFGFGAADLTGALNGDDDVLDRTVRSVVRTAATVPRVDHAGLVLTPRGAFDPQPTTDPVARDLDACQADLREGPGVEVVTRGGTLDVPDLAAVPRWSRFADAAARHDVRGMLAVALTAHDGVLGVLTLYTRSAVDPRGRAIVAGLAAQATVALFGAQRITGLVRAVSSRDVIGRAKGILMQRDGIDDETAFGMLVAASQTTNIKLVDVAHWLVAQADPAAGPGEPGRATPSAGWPDRTEPQR